ncbi:unnamed protein product [Schistocephalus solidus]|uniref:Uncharacterized protein n=1 Tax=Schistocephalus solidus TaxID=70667 RepID=A0A183SC46_SCHSO|nr:unnamed protein product [Schistocephalus solidus]
MSEQPYLGIALLALLAEEGARKCALKKCWVSRLLQPAAAREGARKGALNKCWVSRLLQPAAAKPSGMSEQPYLGIALLDSSRRKGLDNALKKCWVSRLLQMAAARRSQTTRSGPKKMLGLTSSANGRGSQIANYAVGTKQMLVITSSAAGCGSQIAKYAVVRSTGRPGNLGDPRRRWLDRSPPPHLSDEASTATPTIAPSNQLTETLEDLHALDDNATIETRRCQLRNVIQSTALDVLGRARR